MSNNSLNNKVTIGLIEQRLKQSLNPQSLTIQDDSWQHRGHPGARGGGGHFTLWIVDSTLQTMPQIKAHQAIYEILGDLIGREIHALSIQLRPKPEQ